MLGLGSSPDEVVFTDSKGVYSEQGGSTMEEGALDTFWRSAENFKTEANHDWGPDKGMLWAVSQAAPLRRVHVTHSLMLFEVAPDTSGGFAAGFASGGFLADAIVDGTIQAGGQQQWFTRNVQGAWAGGAWNPVFVGVEDAPDARCGGGGSGNMVVVPKTPTIAEKPYIAFDEVAKWTLRVPALRTASSGASWTAGADPSSSDAVYSFTQVYVATAADSAKAINAKLAAGLHVVLSPGIYKLEATLQLSTPKQVLLGLGLATLTLSLTLTLTLTLTRRCLALPSPRLSPPMASPPSPSPTWTACVLQACCCRRARSQPPRCCSGGWGATPEMRPAQASSPTSSLGLAGQTSPRCRRPR